MNWLFGDDINTDLITPGRFNITTDPTELARIAFIEHRPEFAKQVKPGDFIIAGSNFGCGSSRETAPMALRACGIQAIIARSFARIFYRNSMNQGLLVITADMGTVSENDILEIDFEHRQVVNKTNHTKVTAGIVPMMRTLHEAGGMIAYIKKNGLDSVS